MTGIKKHRVTDVPEKDLMSYFDHVKKSYDKGQSTRKDVEDSKKIKLQQYSQYDL